MDTFSVAPDVYGIELAFEGTIVAYLLDDERPTVIETGVAAASETLLDGIREAGVDPMAVEHVVLGHAHLDHSGGAQALVDAAPDATVYLHESMTKWLTNPGRFDRLVESSREALAEAFPEVGAPDGPLPAERVQAVPDSGTEIDTGDRTLEIVHTPGHSPDHVSVWDPEAGLLFANEALGRYYPAADTWVPPTTLPKFDFDQVAASMDRLAAFDAEMLVLSHVGVRPDVDRAFERARDRLATFRERVPELYAANDEDLAATREAVGEELVALQPEYSAREHETQSRMATDCVLNSLELR
ncbi:MBL fold metallo-hydrolase [Natrinema gelatinilyticum]|uniref:MBL fold metallo-hydrolase n=1 Tax=Natrinema gelatinilyticum TaxID=2961571 RepID=UPI0020C443F4|nr:MBL fold metallo-hydrolase [Natrinema gelatinilyticum]